MAEELEGQLEGQLFDLQSRVAFQEDALQQMSDQLARQANDLRMAQQHILLLNQRLSELMQSSGASDFKVDERPPHY